MQLQVIEQRFAGMPQEQQKDIAQSILHLIDTAATASPRATFYNSEDDTVKAAQKVHRAVFDVDRGLYGLTIALPGGLDWSAQLAISAFLRNPKGDGGLLSKAQERQLIHYLARSMPIQRRLKLFAALKNLRVNNERTRSLIKHFVLDDENIEWHAVKYRRKLHSALTHAWGKRRTSIIKSILAKSDINQKERDILDDLVIPFMGDNEGVFALDALSFILGNKAQLCQRLKAYDNANTSADALKELPPEVAEGKRSTFHASTVANTVVVEQTKDKATDRQKMHMQRSAIAKGVRVEFNPSKMDATALYVYAYEQGLTPDVQTALKHKAKQSAESGGFDYDKIGIILDTSASMAGTASQKNRPIAAMLAMRDMLIESAKEDCLILDDHCNGLVELGGDTYLAGELIRLLQAGVDAVFCLSDGYENAPAGRFSEVVERVRQMGIATPIIQVTPTMAAESMGVRKVADNTPTLAINQNPESITTALLKQTLQADLIQGIQLLAQEVLPKLEAQHV